MSRSPQITTLFLDVGGVLLTNGWDRITRRRACQTFQLDPEEVNERHHLTYDTYEVGKLSLDEYLKRLVFYEKRAFSPDDFKKFMFAQSQPHPEMLEFVRRLKTAYNLKLAVVSNEGRELTVYRIKKYGLGSFVDFFIASSLVHFRKPDEDIYRIALDIAQVPPEQVAYLDDRRMFVEVARGLGIHGIHHTGLEPTKKALAALGLHLKETDNIKT
jgi:putative hydrolase of the HAD superfamily